MQLAEESEQLRPIRRLVEGFLDVIPQVPAFQPVHLRRSQKLAVLHLANDDPRGDVN